MLPEGEIDYEASHEQATRDMAHLDDILLLATSEDRLKELQAAREKLCDECGQIDEEIYAVRRAMGQQAIKPRRHYYWTFPRLLIGIGLSGIVGWWISWWLRT